MPIELTASEWTWLSQHESQLTIISDPSYPPLDYTDEKGNQKGMAEDLFNLIENKLNVRFHRLQASSWHEALAMVKKREAAIVKCVAIMPERLEYMLFTQPYIVIPTVMIGQKHKKETLRTQDLKNRRVVACAGYAIIDYLHKNYPDIKVTPVQDDFTGLKMTAAGEADVCLTDLPTASYYIDRYGIANLRVVGDTGYNYSLAIGSRKDWPELNSILIKALNSISREELQSLRKKWVTLEYDRFLYSSKFWLLVIATTAIVGLIVLLFALWNHTLKVQVREKTHDLKQYQELLEMRVEERTRALQQSNDELRAALDRVKMLSGLLPICAKCKKIRDDKGYWNQVEEYVGNHSEVQFSHSLCPDCIRTLYPKMADQLLAE